MSSIPWCIRSSTLSYHDLRNGCGSKILLLALPLDQFCRTPTKFRAKICYNKIFSFHHFKNVFGKIFACFFGPVFCRGAALLSYWPRTLSARSPSAGDRHFPPRSQAGRTGRCCCPSRWPSRPYSCDKRQSPLSHS